VAGPEQVTSAATGVPATEIQIILPEVPAANRAFTADSLPLQSISGLT
jgi:hypothetical protein